MIDLKQLETWVRAGDFAKVVHELRSLTLKNVAREQLAPLANIANRADESRIAFRLLNPIVRSEQELVDPPSELELIEYAEALRRMGLVDEAMALYNTLDKTKFPEVHLRMAFCLFRKWQYSEAIPHLQALLKTKDEQDYMCTIAKVNLAAAFVHERQLDEAMLLLHELCETTQASGHYLLLGNTLELMSQVHISRGDWPKAETALAQAETIFAQNKSKYLFFVKKWRAISRSMQDNVVHAELLACRDQAKAADDWETQRDCDLYIGFIQKDEALLQHVYFGSPQSFRRRVVELIGEDFNFPDSYLWNLANGPLPHRIVDPMNMEKLESGRLLRQFFILLCTDFYQPVALNTIFSKLFQGEHYSQQGSANRVSQLARRLRMWLENTNTGLLLIESKGKYRLETKDIGVAIRVPRDMPLLNPQDLAWQKLMSARPPDQFSRNDVVRILDCSPATAKRLLRWALDKGHAESLGGGTQIRYRSAA